MADDFDWNQFQEAPAQQAVAAAPAQAQGFNWDQFQEVPTDTATGEPKPSYADGLSPQTALNKSPVSIGERAAMGFGNRSGNIKSLEEQFGKGNVIADNKGKLVVKSEGLWHRVDPKNMGDGDAWELSKDLADAVAPALKGALIGGTAGFFAGGIGAIPGALGGAIAGGLADAYGDEVGDVVAKHAGALGVGAAGLAAVGLATNSAKTIMKENLPLTAATAGAELLRTSLGRVLGTYDATPEEQIKDIAFESLLTMGMAFPAAGVKPSATFVGDALKATGKVLKGSPDASKDLIANVIGTTSGAGHANIAHYIENPNEVSATIKRLGVGAASASQMVERATSESIGAVESIAKKVPEARSAVWNKFTDDILNEVGPEFQSNVDDLVIDAQKRAVGTGIGKFVKTVADDSNIDAKISGETALKKTVLGIADIEKYAAEGKQGLPEGVTFELKPHAQIEAEAKLSGKVPKEFLDKDSYQFVDKFFNGLKTFENMKSLPEKEGAEQVMDFKRYLGNMTYKITETAKEESLPATAMAIKDIESSLDSRLASKFAKPDGTNSFLERNEFWKSSSEEMSNVLRTIDRARKTQSIQPFEDLFKHITSRPGMNAVKKEGFDAAIEVIKQAGMDIEPQVKQLKTLQSARSLTPWVRSGTGTNVLYAAGGALASGNVPLAIGTTAVAGALSPTVNKVAIDAALGSMSLGKKLAANTGAEWLINSARASAQKISQSQVVAAFNGLDFLKSMPAKHMMLMLQDPKMLNTFFSIVGNSPQVESQIKDQLLNHALQQTAPLNNPIQPPTK